MPQVELTKLLRERPLRHPTYILRGMLEARTFTLTVRGGSSWIAGVFDLVFEEVSGGLLDLPLIHDQTKTRRWSLLLSRRWRI